MARQQQQQQAPLQLDSAAYGEATGWRRGEHLIDALPYIDPLTPDVKREVEALIEEEMRSSSKRPADYLKELPPVPPAKFEGHPLLQAEYERVRARQPMPPLDVARFRLDPPPAAKRSDPAAWQAALDNAHAQLEHQLNRIANLELLLKFGPNTWRAQAATSAAVAKQLERDLAATRAAVDRLNRERKVQQMAAGNELRRLEDEWAGAVRKNLEVSLACGRLEAEVRMLRAQLPEDARRRLDEAAAAAGGSGGGGGGGGGDANGGGSGMNGQHADGGGSGGGDPMDE